MGKNWYGNEEDVDDKDDAQDFGDDKNDPIDMDDNVVEQE